MTRNIHTMTTMTTPATGPAATNARADEAASRELFAARAELASLGGDRLTLATRARAGAPGGGSAGLATNARPGRLTRRSHPEPGQGVPCG